VPGSTFKTVTASAAVDSGAVDLQAPFLCTTGVKVGTYSVDCKNSQHVPRLTYQQAFAWSSNRVFGLTGLLLGFPDTRPINAWLDDAPPGPYPWTRPDASIKSSADVLVDYAHRFGFDRSVPFDLPVEQSHVKRPATSERPVDAERDPIGGVREFGEIRVVSGMAVVGLEHPIVPERASDAREELR